MIVKSSELARRAARGIVFVLIAGLSHVAPALSQEESTPEATEPAAAPADAAPAEAAPAEATPADAPAETPAPATEGTAETAPPVDTIPVQAGEAETPPAATEGTKLDTIEVTGSRIKRTDYETAQPVLVLKREDIERTGLTNIGDILQRIPAAGSALNRNFNNGGNGQTEIDLRNLGSQRVLVLVNGHRWVSGTSFAGTSSVDLNTIPVSIIERIEVLKDGASAIYGSDAITGVINVITRKDYVGTEARAYVSGYSSGPTALQKQANVSYGTVSGKTSTFLDINYVKQDELFASARDLSKVPQFGTGHTRGSLFTPRGTLVWFTDDAHASTINTAYQTNPNPGENEPCLSTASVVAGGLPREAEGTPIPVDPNSAPAQAAYVCIMILRPGETVGANETLDAVAPRYESFNKSSLDTTVNDAYNFAPINYLLTPFEQTSLFGQVNHQLTDDLSLRGTVLLNINKTERNLAETPLLFGQGLGIPPPYDKVFIDANNVYNPFDQDIGRDTGGQGVAPGAGILARRFSELGARFVGREVQTLMVSGIGSGGFDALDRYVSWDLGAAMARSNNTNQHRGDLRMDRVGLALGPSFIDSNTNQPTCGTQAAPISGCVPLNLFGGPGSITNDMLDYIKYEATSAAENRTDNAFGSLSTELSDFGFLAGPVGLALGAEYRNEEFAEQPDPYTVSGLSSTNLRDPTGGGYSTKEAFAEIALPLLKDLPAVDVLDLSVAGRYVSYDTFGSKLTGKGGLRWKPIDDLLVRGTMSQAFRAPAISDLYLGSTDSYPEVSDPCAASPRPANWDSNCNAEGAPATTQQLALQVLTRFGGNPELDPETANTVTAGIVYSPSFLPEFNVYADWYSLTLDDAIAFQDPQFVLDSCYKRATGAPRPANCDLVHRQQGANAAIMFMEDPAVNLSQIKTSGFEVSFDYKLPVADWFPSLETGAFKLTFDSSYLDAYDQYIRGVNGEKIHDDTIGPGRAVSNQPYPRFKANASLTWAIGDWETSWTTRYVGATTEACLDATSALFGEPELKDLGLCSKPDFFIEEDDPTTVDDPTTPEIENDETGTDHSENELPAKFYHNVQVVYQMKPQNMSITLGALNVTDTQPARSTQAFANSFSSTLYEVPGVQPYLRITKSF